MTASNVFKMEHRVNYYECDPSGHISLSTLIALLILASEKQNAELGVDEHTTLKMGGGWVIIDYEAHFDQECPRENDVVQLQTQVLAYNKFFVVRQFVIVDATGNPIGKVKGLFVYMDLKKRKMVKIPEAIMAPYVAEATSRLPKVARPDKVETDSDWQSRQYRVRYFDIDYNGHVNNAKYFDWMLDTVDHDFLKNHRITDLRMNYEHEVRPQTIVTSQSVVTHDQKHQIVTHHKIMVGDEECASATMTWQ